jgi:hypothetical protein
MKEHVRPFLRRFGALGLRSSTTRAVGRLQLQAAEKDI